MKAIHTLQNAPGQDAKAAIFVRRRLKNQNQGAWHGATQVPLVGAKANAIGHNVSLVGSVKQRWSLLTNVLGMI